MAERYWRLGFSDFKVKLSDDRERDREKLAVFEQWPEALGPGAGGREQSLAERRSRDRRLRSLGYPFFAVEEPIGRNRYAELSRHLAARWTARSSWTRAACGASSCRCFDGPPSRWLINVRVSKMGGLLRSLEVVDAARARGIGVIVGAQVGETSLLTRAALTVARAAGDALVAQEGAFGTFLLERDVCDPPLMFGAGGVLDVAAYPMLTGPGLGLSGPGCQGQRLHPSAR